MLANRPSFDKRAASTLIGWREDTPGSPPRPALVIDEADESKRYLRTGEALTYVRNLLSPRPISQQRFDGLLAEIDVHRLRLEQRRGPTHYRMSLYEVPK